MRSEASPMISLEAAARRRPISSARACQPYSHVVSEYADAVAKEHVHLDLAEPRYEHISWRQYD